MAGITREELESLGLTDEKLEELCKSILGSAPNLSGQPDTIGAQLTRDLWFEQMMLHAQGGYELQLSEPMGSFAEVRDELQDD